MNLRPRTTEDPTINLTSLIDVVFLLLIFFMVSTSFTKESELKIVLPQAEVDSLADLEPELEILITASGGYYLNEKELINNNPETLREAILSEIGDEREITLTIRADGQTTHQSVVVAMDVAGKLGISNMNIVTIKQAN